MGMCMSSLVAGGVSLPPSDTHPARDVGKKSTSMHAPASIAMATGGSLTSESSIEVSRSCGLVQSLNYLLMVTMSVLCIAL